MSFAALLDGFTPAIVGDEDSGVENALCEPRLLGGGDAGPGVEAGGVGALVAGAFGLGALEAEEELEELCDGLEDELLWPGVDELLGGAGGGAGAAGGVTTGIGAPICMKVGPGPGAVGTSPMTASVSTMVCSGNRTVCVTVSVVVTYPGCRSSPPSRGRRANKYFW